MKATDLLIQSLEENEGYIQAALKWLSEDDLRWSPKPHSNSIIFLMWHLARVEDLWINRILKAGKGLATINPTYLLEATSVTRVLPESTLYLASAAWC